jgi:hypothetical protein
MTKIRWILVITIICLAVLVAGFRLTQPEPEIVEAAPVPPAVALVKTETLDVQATSIEEVEARRAQTVLEQMAVFADEQSGYHVSYPLDWEQLALSTSVALFQSPDGASKVKVEAVGPLPADGLAPFVDRSLGDDIVYSRQLLTVHGLPAERVVAYSVAAGSQVTTFYIDQGASVFVVTGNGDQKSIEMIARSFNAPQVVAQR